MPPPLARCGLLATSVLLAWGCSKAAADLSGYFLDEQEKGAVAIRGGYMMLTWTVASIPSTAGVRVEITPSTRALEDPCGASLQQGLLVVLYSFLTGRLLVASSSCGVFWYFSYFRSGRVLGV